MWLPGRAWLGGDESEDTRDHVSEDARDVVWHLDPAFRVVSCATWPLGHAGDADQPCYFLSKVYNAQQAGADAVRRGAARNLVRMPRHTSNMLSSAGPCWQLALCFMLLAVRYIISSSAGPC